MKDVKKHPRLLRGRLGEFQLRFFAHVRPPPFQEEQEDVGEQKRTYAEFTFTLFHSPRSLSMSCQDGRDLTIHDGFIRNDCEMRRLNDGTTKAHRRASV